MTSDDPFFERMDRSAGIDLSGDESDDEAPQDINELFSGEEGDFGEEMEQIQEVIGGSLEEAAEFQKRANKRAQIGFVFGVASAAISGYLIHGYMMPEIGVWALPVSILLAVFIGAITARVVGTILIMQLLAD